MSTAVARRQRKAEVQELIEAQAGAESALLDALGVPVEVFCRIALNAIVKYPKIAECSNQSLLTAIVRCIELGLVPDGDHAALVPFRGEAVLIPMIAGRLKLARAATPGLVVRPRAVYDGDTFRHREGLSPVLEHVPDPKAARDDKHLVAVYAVADWPDAAGAEWVVMYRPEIDRRARRSPSWGKPKGPWSTDFEQMAMKTVLGVLLKRLPKRPGAVGFDRADETLAQVGLDPEAGAAEISEWAEATWPDDTGAAAGDRDVVDVEDAEIVDAGDDDAPPRRPPVRCEHRARDGRRCVKVDCDQRRHRYPPKDDPENTPAAEPEPLPEPEPEPEPVDREREPDPPEPSAPWL